MVSDLTGSKVGDGNEVHLGQGVGNVEVVLVEGQCLLGHLRSKGFALWVSKHSLRSWMGFMIMATRVS